MLPLAARTKTNDGVNGQMTLWIKNGKTLHQETKQWVTTHLKIADGRIAQVLHGQEPGSMDGEVLDAKGKLLTAGLIDMHVHFREPGFEHKETIESGANAAAQGGFTTVACMPNTRPVIDTPETLQHVYNQAKAAGAAKVLSYACITKNQLGRELTDFEALKAAGAAGYTDDGVGVQSAQMMKDAMYKAAELGLPVIAHCEDNTLVEGAAVTEGAFAKKHGLKGIPNESEAIHVGRDILLAEATGVHYHVCHVSTEQSVRLIRQAKALGIHVTAEVCPHHLLLSDEDIPGLDANWKMNPPLRTPKDVQAMLEGIEDGTIDMIVTDHAPHSEEEKAQGMDRAPFGIVGLETAFPLLYTHFVKTGRWSLAFLLEKMTTAPAAVFGLEAGALLPGRAADITVIDLQAEREVDPASFASKGRNTPFSGWKLQGWPTLTLVDGKIVYQRQEAE